MSSKEAEAGSSKAAEEEAKDAMPPPPKTFKVVKDLGGNARTQSISHFPREIDQVVLDLSTYLVEHAPDDGLADIAGLPEADLAKLESALNKRLPQAVQGLLLKHNGGVRIYEYLTLSADAITAAIEEHRSSEEWDAGFVPFGRDIDGTLLGLVYGAAEGESKAAAGSGGAGAGSSAASAADGCYVAEWSADDGLQSIGERQTAATYLETFRNRLLSHQFEYIPDVGLVERVGAASSPSKKHK